MNNIKERLGWGIKLSALSGSFSSQKSSCSHSSNLARQMRKRLSTMKGTDTRTIHGQCIKKFIKRLENSIENFVREIGDDEDIAVIGKELRRASMVDPTSRLSILGAIMREAFAFTTFVHFARRAAAKTPKLANTTD